jgi:malate synthase
VTSWRRSIYSRETFIPAPLLASLIEQGEPVKAIPGLRVASGLREEFPGIETEEALAFVCELYMAVAHRLEDLLARREKDRLFVDATTQRCVEENEAANRSYLDPAYQTVIGAKDDEGRVVIGESAASATGLSPADVQIPEFWEGEHVTLFGPPDTARMSINAMNALNRKAPEEPPLITRLVEESGQVPRWGADNEDSKTPIMRSFLRACENLTGCFEGTLTFHDPVRDRTYRLDETGRSKPIKRIPGLALPDGSHLLHGEPLPLHLVDFALHLYHNCRRPEALAFYIPKLENEEEAAYVHTLISRAEEMIRAIHPTYTVGSVRLFIVFENPRAIFRIRRMAETLAPYFLGGSLGWHDFLASTARLFKHDPHYRIPVKADPNIVINHIKESHLILARALDPIGGIKIGGMYGVLFEEGNPASMEVSMVGYIKDVVTQLKRGLNGFWVAHPAFVRPGIALVQAFRQSSKVGDMSLLHDTISALVPNPAELAPLLDFVSGADVPGLAHEDPLYPRAVLAATLETSDVIANHDPEEVRYNIFQALQYLADWLSGNGCVALPATMKNARGENVVVRVMDDLATTERSRWELWAEVFHGRVPVLMFDQILAEEVAFIRENRETAMKRIAVRWQGEAARWYPIAVRLLRLLVVTPKPVEWVPELLLPFTFDPIRHAPDPWAAATALCPGKFEPCAT